VTFAVPETVAGTCNPPSRFFTHGRSGQEISRKYRGESMTKNGKGRGKKAALMPDYDIPGIYNTGKDSAD